LGPESSFNPVLLTEMAEAAILSIRKDRNPLLVGEESDPMAKSNPDLINALRETANRLDNGARYEWGHMGRCNCGHLVQTITCMTDYEIVESIDFQLAEWSEHAVDYCEHTGHKVDDLFLTLDQLGFGWQDVVQLENLSDKQVLNRLAADGRFLRRNQVEDVTLYIRTLADLLEEELTV
jgi:hypothetical protein